VKAWFEDGSAVRKGIADEIGYQVQFREFRWSGRNSFSARRKASAEFERHLDGAMMENPETMHVIVAHSHGGTVAAHSIAYRSMYMRGESRVKALICLSTPFAYLSSVSRKDDFLFFTATGAILGALVLALIPVGINPWFVLAFTFAGPFSLALPLFLLRTYPSNRDAFPPINSSISVFLIRATRDEAALSIGLAQSFHALSQALYRLREQSLRLGWPLFVSFAAEAIFLIPGLIASIWKLGAHFFDAWQYIICYPLVFASSIAGIMYVGSYALIALVVGFTDLRLWPATIEVDAAPPHRDCIIKSYSLENVQTTSLRHGIYELPGVQRDIASIIQSVAEGSTPRLPTGDYFLFDLSPHWAVPPLKGVNVPYDFDGKS
jgi:hypothetical protein